MSLAFLWLILPFVVEEMQSQSNSRDCLHLGELSEAEGPNYFLAMPLLHLPGELFQIN